MPNAGFLDKSVLLGFCFRTDPHYSQCEGYLNQSKEFYITPEIEKAFERNRERMIEDHTDSIRLHIMDLRSSSFSGPLGANDLRQIKEDVLFDGNEVSEFLERWYNETVTSGMTRKQIEERLRYLARDVEKRAYERKDRFDNLVSLWDREDDYPSLEETLSNLSAEDKFVCIDAHDVAANLECDTELATADESDFIENGREELILENTELDRIVGLSVSSQ